MKKVTSITLHTTAEGQRISYTYSEINESTGEIISDNNRGSFLVLETLANESVLSEISAVKSYVSEKVGV